ncbi:hypothetical protein CEQ90_17530 [Lewinellaceae bacterium SD302]|nr:hypothetical protein CEQ90_17530 [Lewinellaceae bacterium SD302]
MTLFAGLLYSTILVGQDCTGDFPVYVDFNNHTTINGNTISVDLNMGGGARSVKFLPAGVPGSICYNAPIMFDAGDKTFGFSPENPDDYYGSTKYGFFFNNQGFQIIVDGNKLPQGPVAHAANDLFAIQSRYGTILFYHNAQLVHSQQITQPEDLFLDVSLISDLGDPDVSFEDIIIDFGPEMCMATDVRLAGCAGEQIVLSVGNLANVSDPELYNLEWSPTDGLSCTTCLTTVLTPPPGSNFLQYTATLYYHEQGEVCSQSFSISELFGAN